MRACRRRSLALRHTRKRSDLLLKYVHRRQGRKKANAVYPQIHPGFAIHYSRLARRKLSYSFCCFQENFPELYWSPKRLAFIPFHRTAFADRLRNAARVVFSGAASIPSSLFPPLTPTFFQLLFTPTFLSRALPTSKPIKILFTSSSLPSSTPSPCFLHFPFHLPYYYHHHILLSFLTSCSSSSFMFTP